MRHLIISLSIVTSLCLPGGTSSGQELPAVPQGVEVLTRGPVHEAFATPTSEPVAPAPIAKRPPKPLDELPPDDKPEGALWIGGYWAWDEDRSNFLWVSGVWRTPPPGQRWVAGSWREVGDRWQWVPGYWAATENHTAQTSTTCLPAPPPLPEVAPPGAPPTPDSFYVPGAWVWRGDGYAWRAGYWARIQPGYVWVPAHYRWTPGGYVFIPGYWDLALSRRGVLYAPVVVDEVVVGPTFVYRPAYVVCDTVMLDSLFVRPSYCHYYFGDYYGPVYRDYGFESCVIYSRRRYDAIFVYERWERRDDPHWEVAQMDICLARHAGQAPCPPRTLVQQNVLVQQNITNVNVVNQTQIVVPRSQLSALQNRSSVPAGATSRPPAQHAVPAIQQVGAQVRPPQPEAAAAQAVPPRPTSASAPPGGLRGPASPSEAQKARLQAAPQRPGARPGTPPPRPGPQKPEPPPKRAPENQPKNPS